MNAPTNLQRSSPPRRQHVRAKASLRSQLLAKMSAPVAAGLIRVVKATSTKIYEPPDLIERLRAQVPFIMAMWHGQFMMLAALNTREFDVAAMVARHGDAEIMAHVLAKFGISSIRGAGAGRRKKNRGGVYALRAAHHALDEGTIVAMTADVPLTKARVAGDGIVTLARLSGRPIIPVAAATSRYAVFNTWSKLTLNMPFSRLAIVAGDPIFVASDADESALETARTNVEQSLNAVTARAYELARNASRRTNNARDDASPTKSASH